MRLLHHLILNILDKKSNLTPPKRWEQKIALKALGHLKKPETIENVIEFFHNPNGHYQGQVRLYKFENNDWVETGSFYGVESTDLGHLEYNGYIMFRGNDAIDGSNSNFGNIGRVSVNRKRVCI